MELRDAVSRVPVAVSIIVPTYKEALNITPLSEQIDEAMRNAGLSYEIVIVDDDSNDGIIDAVNQIKDKYNIRLFVRKGEKGLSSAVIAGFAHASGNTLVVMDADLSHRPSEIPALVAPIMNNSHDFAIGSRFVEGGSASHFNFYRRMNAKVSKMMARPFTTVSDPMAGFFAFPKKLLTTGLFLNPLGFKIGLEMIVKAAPKSIHEIPIHFRERLFGKSKLSLKEQLRYLAHLGRLFEYKYQTTAEFLKFCLVGGLGMAVDLTFVYLSMTLFTLFGVVPELIKFRISRIVGFVFALTSNFLLNRKITFLRAEQGNGYRQYASFFAVCLTGLAVNFIISVRLFDLVPFFKTHYLAASFLGIVGGTAFNFIGSKLFVFKRLKTADHGSG